MMNFSVFLNVNLQEYWHQILIDFQGQREDFLGYLKSSDFDFTIHK